MKKRLLILILLLFPINIYAYELTCDEGSYTYNNSFSCKLTGNIEEYNNIQGTISTDDNLSCKITSVNDGFNIIDKNDYYFELNGTPTSTDLVTYTCNVITKLDNSTNTQISISDFSSNGTSEIVRSDYIKLSKYSEVVETNTKPRNSNDSDLQLKSLSSEGLDFTFSQLVNEYNVEVLYEVSEVNFNYTLNNPESIVEIKGDTKLIVGTNVIDIYVYSSDYSKENCYTLTITRLPRGQELYYEDKDSSLKSLTVKGYSINFDTNIYEYNIHLTSDVSSVTVVSNATVDGAIISTSSTEDLKNGSIISVLVTSKDGSNTTEYRINITKDAEKKDYSQIIILSILGIAFVTVVVIFIITSQKKKSDDPLIKAAKKKRKINKGEKFDSSLVPETNNENNQVINEQNNVQNVIPQVIENTTQTVVNPQINNEINNIDNSNVVKENITPQNVITSDVYNQVNEGIQASNASNIQPQNNNYSSNTIEPLPQINLETNNQIVDNQNNQSNQ